MASLTQHQYLRIVAAEVALGYCSVVLLVMLIK